MLSNCALPVALAWQVWSWVVVKLRCAGRSCIFGMRHTAYIYLPLYSGCPGCPCLGLRLPSLIRDSISAVVVVQP